MNFFILNSGKSNAAANMALDEALLEAMPRLQTPVLRLYGWTEPAATFGYFQKYSEVAAATRLRPLLRRPTGGGIVPHDVDWTYAAVFPPGHEWHGLKAEESYRRIHDWLRLAFAELGIETRLAPCCQKAEGGGEKAESGKRKAETASKCSVSSVQCSDMKTSEEGKAETNGAAPKSAIGNRQSAIPSACFIGHEKSDLLWHGKKIAGAAQRRNQLGLLIQGSVQPPPVPLVRETFESALRRVGENFFAVNWTDWSPDSALLDQAEFLVRTKYALPEYNQKR